MPSNYRPSDEWPKAIASMVGDLAFFGTVCFFLWICAGAPGVNR